MTNSTSHISQNLIARYLLAVRFWLPRRQQADIVAELSEDLRSQVEDKEAELGRPLNEAETTAILKRCGSPIVVAGRYQPQTHLIGPVLFPIYKFVMKLVLLWAMPTLFLVIIGPTLVLTASDHMNAFFSVLGTFWTVLFTTGAVITMVFAILERTEAKLQLNDKWDVRSLPQLPRHEKPTPRALTVFEAVFSFLGVLWYLAVPFYPFLILGPAAAFLRFAPAWSQYYWMILFIAFVVVAQQVLGLARPQWDWFPPVSRLISTALGLIFVGLVLNFATRTPNGEWHPYVVLIGSLQASANMRQVESIVNLGILVSFAGAWLGLCIAALVHAWELMRFLRKNYSGAGSPALMHLF
jgi:hypothetical protein